MTRIAHLTDLHLNGTRDRYSRFRRGLEGARRWGASHLVLTGDLTADGKQSQYAEVAGVLVDWPSHAVTIVPGNHDGGPRDFQRALAGPLGRFMNTSQPGTIIDRGDVVIAAISTQIDQPWPMARGRVDAAQLAQLDQLRRDRRAVVIAMHHPPLESTMGTFDELINRHEVASLIANSTMHALCGHDHRILDVGHIHTAGCVVDHDDPLRIYDVVGRDLHLTYRGQNQSTGTLPDLHQLG